MSRRISWDDFSVNYPATGEFGVAVNMPSEEDWIIQSREVDAVDRGVVEFGLHSEPHITWWKGLRAFDCEGRTLGTIETHDDNHGAHYIRVARESLTGGWLDLEKAKMFGIHTGMYRLLFDEMPHGPGTRYTFTWRHDAS